MKRILAHNSEIDSLAEEVKVCNECFNTANLLGREAILEVKSEDESIDVYFPHSLVTLNELKSIIKPRIHSSHIIDNSLAEGVVKSAIKRIIDEEYNYSPKHKAALKAQSPQ